MRGEAYLNLDQGAEAATEFEKILNHRGIVFGDPIGALMGWLVVLGIKPVLTFVSLHGFLWALGGGLFYTVGVFFYASKRIPYSHVIWHGFALCGSICHYWAVFFYVLPARVLDSRQLRAGTRGPRDLSRFLLHPISRSVSIRTSPIGPKLRPSRSDDDLIFVRRTRRMIRHPHKFTIADDAAVHVLVEQLMSVTNRQQQQKLLRVGADARHYKDSKENACRAFFHGC